jgi:hypothetical protein
MYPLFAETHTAAGTLRLERIDRPADSRNELCIPPGHTRGGIAFRATPFRIALAGSAEAASFVTLLHEPS